MNAWNIIGVSSGILTLLISIGGFCIRMMVRTAILDANDVQLAKINGTYTRSAGSTLTGAEIERSLTAGGLLR